MKHFLTIGEHEPDQLTKLLDDALTIKQMQKSGKSHPYTKGKVLGMIFEKSSTRTRVSFEVGMLQMGGNAIFLNSNDIQLGRGESISDTAQVLSRYVDGIMIRTFGHETVEQFAEHSSVPIINGLTDMHHPTQVMADLLTILEHKGKLKGLKMCYVGDGDNNMCHSLIEGALSVGMDIAVASPKGYEPNETIVSEAKKIGEKTESQYSFTTDPITAIQEADVVVTDVWASMGQEGEQANRMKDLYAYQVNKELCQYAKDDFIFLHCLPAHRGEEVTADVIDGPHSVVFDEAENRLHAQKAILKALLENK
ncbi:ornithine carbamoyltransferase [Salirhabdus salicampi]|uniref:ornithine carbamoyltransferase n=1 Tax=Salirhabdus salicampi TaxID=476102 RepID=UPI0020C2D636|nr:ornithine carbamoyltransferase [Salirhabdus salicampi]MCP8617323.1 ornithine carbamoyltransferase [Salirhabdus salicampi]